MTEHTNRNNYSYGRVWEEMLEKIFMKKLPKHVKVVDAADTMRDRDENSVPDLMLVDTKTHKNVYYDAKRKTFYWDKNNKRSVFTLDASITESYRSIADKTDSKVYIAVWDDKKDPDHYYLLDVSVPETDRYMYDNQYNKDGKPSYRWAKELFTKIKIEESVDYEHYLTA